MKEVYSLLIYNKDKETSSFFWNRELIIINLNPRQASPTSKHSKKKKKVNSIKFFQKNINLTPIVIIDRSSNTNNINLIWEYSFIKIINLLLYQIRNMNSIDLPLKIIKIINKYKHWNKLRIIGFSFYPAFKFLWEFDTNY